MGNRVNGLIVSLDSDIREEDVEVIVNAIKMIKGVQDVGVNIIEHKDWLNRTKIRHQLQNKVYKAIEEAFKESE
ncbi:hypothetical protein AAHB47_01495 [Bacillus wiedmannii]